MHASDRPDTGSVPRDDREPQMRNVHLDRRQQDEEYFTHRVPDVNRLSPVRWLSELLQVDLALEVLLAADLPSGVAQAQFLRGRVPRRFDRRSGVTPPEQLADPALLVGGGVWGLSQAIGDGAEADPVADGSSEAPEEEPVEEEDPGTLVVRFDPSEQAEPEPGVDERVWVYTPVTRDDEIPRNQGIPSHEAWAEQWEEAGDPGEAVIRTDAEVKCARFCAAPEHVFLDEEARGTWDLSGGDFVDYLSWGPVMIVELTFAEDQEGDGPREVVGVVELFSD